MKQIVKTINNFLKKTIFKVKNKTNNNFNFDKFIKQFINKFNKSVQESILKLKSKKKSTLKITTFNKFIITFISLLFFYVFYLSIPILYDKTWVQSEIEKKLKKEFQINFSLSSDISYYILPTPHFLIKDAKILSNDIKKIKSISEIKNLKIFISQKNFFNKSSLKLKKVIINKANISFNRYDLKLLNNSSNNRFSNKKIEINDSKIFLKDDSDETFTIIKVLKAFLLFDNEKLSNLFKINGDVFNIPFIFNLTKEINSLKNNKINFTANKLRLNILNEFNKNEMSVIKGNNIISFFNYKIDTEYTLDDGLISFRSTDSELNNSKISYKGVLSIDPFNLDLDINLGNFKTSKILKMNNILSEVVKTELLFNDNMSIDASIVAFSNIKDEIFQKTKINLNIINGKINLDQSKLVNDKIGFIEIRNSDLFFKGDNLIFNSNMLINIENHKNFFSFLQTNKRLRKPIEKVLINFDYDFLTKKINFNNVKIDGEELNDDLLGILDSFNNNNSHNLIKSKRIINDLFNAYAG
tara:strand:- start:1023 stop:2603 length:1581 start_codon:yes stop_codon:yes gene_type:complete